MDQWDLSCPDWIDRLKAGRSLVPALPQLDRRAGNRAVAVFNKLRLADVGGTPTMAEAGGEWFRDIVRALFGAYDVATATRMIVEIFLLVPKKNNKTTGGALLMLTALLLNERPRAPFALMAPVQDTANEAFEAAAGAIALDPVLDKKFHVRNQVKTIIHRETKADLQIMTFDPDILTGRKFVGTLIDELHVIAKNAKAAKALRQVRGGMLPFPEAFLAFITTMPNDPPAGVMKSELTKAREIRDGKRRGKTLAVLYEYPKEMQQDKAAWMDPANWPIVNPNIGRSVTIPKLLQLFEAEAANGEYELRGWASQHLNIEIGIGLMGESWAGGEFWERNALKDGLTLEDIIERCDVATFGVDGGGLDDLLAACVLGRDRETGEWLAWFRAWAHPIVLERRKEIAQQLLDLKELGELVLVEHMGDDIDELADLAEQIYEAGLFNREDDAENSVIPAIGMDPVGVGAIIEAFVARRIPKEKIIGISQGWKMTGAIKTAERKLAQCALRHGGSRLATWAVGNAKVEPRGNAIVITKQASGTAKIDPVMALFDAVSLMTLVPESAGPSFWEVTAVPVAPA